MYRQYLFEATQRYHVRILTWMVTSNHIHLLLTGGERGRPAISEALQYVHGETAEHYNLTRNCEGSFWSNRFHATRIQDGGHLGRCLFYIDLNMVRAGVVSHPSEWAYGSWAELVGARRRYRIIDLDTLLNRLRMTDADRFALWYRRTLDDILCQRESALLRRQAFYSSAIAVGDEDWPSTVASRLDTKRYKIHPGPEPIPALGILKTSFLGRETGSKGT